MKALHLTELAAHVVAWHNRHPLARRISAVHVHSMGVVVLPFVAPAGATAAGAAPAIAAGPATPPDGRAAPDSAEGTTLRERAMARQQTAAAPASAAPAAAAAASPAAAPVGTLRAAFSEDLMPPLSAAQVARWSARHGAPLPTPAGDAPVRQVKADDGVDSARLSALWVLTAQLDVGKRRVRLLVAPGLGPGVLGERLWSAPRLAGLAALVAALTLALAAGGYAALKRPQRPGAAAPLQTAAKSLQADAPTTASASAPGTRGEPARAAATASGSGAASAMVSASVSAPMSASASASTSAPVSASVSASVSAALSTPASAAASATYTPLDVEATPGRVALPSLGPRIERRRQAAALAAAASAPSVAARPAAPPPQPTAVAAPVAALPAATTAAVSTPPAITVSAAPAAAASTPAAAQQPGATGRKAPTFAIATRLLRTRSESLQVAAALRALLVTPDAQHLHVEVLPSGDDFRVLAWPYGQRAEAEKVRARLASRGLKVEVVDF